MSDHQRVFVTGFSALTACGATADATWNAVLEGKTGIDEISAFDLSTWTHRLGGEIRGLQPAALLPDRKLAKVISRQDVSGIHAATEAVKHSGMIPYRDTLSCPQAFNNATGVYVGSPGNKYFQQYDFLPLLTKSDAEMPRFAQDLFNEVHPTWLLRILPNNVLAYTGITYGFKGPNHNITNHAASGAQAILEAYHAIARGQAQRVVVVAYDYGIEPQALFYYARLGVLSPRHLKPFDAEHDGTILAEGAAAIVLESERSATARAATCHAQLLGGHAATESTGLFAIESSGNSLHRLLKNTLDSTGLTPDTLDCIVAHGNGNPSSDDSESRAIGALGEDAIGVTAFKWAMGHTLAASGVVDTVLAVQALKHRTLPGIAPLSDPASCSKSLLIQATHRELPQKATALVINRGFAGMNACVALKACD